MENHSFIDARPERVDNLARFIHFDNKDPGSQTAGATKRIDDITIPTSSSKHLPELSLNAASAKKPELAAVDSYNLDDMSGKQLLDLGVGKLSSIHADTANFAAFMVRMKSESIAANLVKAGTTMGRSEVMGLSSVPLAGLTGYAMYKDWQNFKSSTDLCDKSFYAAQTAFDATAAAGAVVMPIAPFRAAATTVAALSIGARLATGLVHGGVDIGRGLFSRD